MSRSIARLAVTAQRAVAATPAAGPSTPAASTSTRSYATKPATNDPLSYMSKHTSPTDSRADILRHILYPPTAHLPRSASPTGAHHPDHTARLQAVIPNEEYYETIERAWKLYRRHATIARQRAIRQKYEAMVSACEELDRVTEQGQGVDRRLYHQAMKRNDPQARERLTGRRSTPEQRWLETRMEGLWPRETWVPTETRGKGWNYEWKRPAGR